MQNIPKGTYPPSYYQKFLFMNRYVFAEGTEKIICPFKYTLMGYVIVMKRIMAKGDLAFFLHHEASRELLLCAIRIKNVIGAKYLITSPRTHPNKGDKDKQGAKGGKCVGYLRGNLMRDQFILFDEGFNPKKKQIPVRKQLACYEFTKTSFFNFAPVASQITVPIFSGDISDCRQNESIESIPQVEGIVQVNEKTVELKKRQKSSPHELCTIRSQEPVFNAAKKVYEMDLQGLVTSISPFNSVLKEETNQKCLLMGKRSENTFHIYVGAPLCLLQGFGYFLAKYENQAE